MALPSRGEEAGSESIILQGERACKRIFLQTAFTVHRSRLVSPIAWPAEHSTPTTHPGPREKTATGGRGFTGKALGAGEGG